MNDIDFKLIVSVVAMIASFISLYFTKINWIQSNRPIVTVFVNEHSSGNQAAAFNLVVANTGNRPAVRVRLAASREEIRNLVEPDISERRFEQLAQIFMESSEVPLLRNGEELTTSLGAFTPNDPNGKWLKYGAECQITVLYNDLDDRSYKSKLPLKIYARHGFGGGAWG